MKAVIRRLWLTANPWRALAEGLGVSVLLTLVLAVPMFGRTSSVLEATLVPSFGVSAGVLGIPWVAVRLRPERRRWWLRLARSLALGAAFALIVVPALYWLAEVNVTRQTQPPRHVADDVVLLPAILTMPVVGYAAEMVLARVVVHALRAWNRLRRGSVMWSLTHAQLMIAAAVGGVFTLLIGTLTVLTRSGPGFAALTLIAFTAVLLGIGLLLSLPFVALVSFVATRPLVERISTLMHATAELKDGNYAVRVPVESTDEVGRLQQNFNVMAGDLERARKSLEAERDTVATLLRSRRELVASVSHELRTPVATIRGYLESAQAHWDDTPPATLRDDLGILEREVIRLQWLIEDLFALSRAETRALELHCAPVASGAVARRVVETVAPLAWQTARVEVTAHVATDLPLAVADHVRLQQVLRNLLHNAVRHTQPGGIVAVTAHEEPDAIVLAVSDTGEGIPADELAHVWERFYRGASGREREAGGTGLGLALVKELTEAMGGSVAVASAPGEGSRFSVRLPRAPQVTPQTDSLLASASSV